jgi:hypothetical protein
MYDWCQHTKTKATKERPEWVKADQMTEAQFKEELADTTTAFVEEADKVKSLKDAERWLKLRYDETSKEKTYRTVRQNQWGKPVFPEETHNHFGYTVVHVQDPFQTPELTRRLMSVNIDKDVKRAYKKVKVDEDARLVEIANGTVDWDGDLGFARSGSAWDCWEPLYRIAAALADEAFVEHVFAEVKSQTAEEDTYKLFEPKYMVLGEIIPLYLKRLQGERHRISIVELRELIKPRDASLNEMQIAKIARGWKFEMYKPGGRANIKVISREQLDAITAKADIDVGEVEEAQVTMPQASEAAEVA